MKVKNGIYKYIINEFMKNDVDINLIFFAMLDTIVTTVGTKNMDKLIDQVKREL